MRKLVIAILSLLLLLGALRLTKWLIDTTPEAERKRPPKTAALVELSTLTPGDQVVTLQLAGTVVPAEEIRVQSRVAGEIVAMGPGFIDGGLLKKGDPIVTIDPVDYELALADAESKLEAARFEYKSELGRQEIAKHEWELLKTDDATELEKELALRKPHLAADKAALAAAEAALKRARVDLERTKIRAPFNAVVTKRDAHLGSQASMQSELGALVGTDAYWVMVSIPIDRLNWIQVPGATARVISASGTEREGVVIKLMGELEEKGRMARLLVEIRDPLALLPENAGLKPLLLGEYVRAELRGTTLANAFSLPRLALREGSTIWINDGGKLAVRPVEVLWRDAERVLIREGAVHGEKLIVSDLTAPVPGMDVVDVHAAPKRAKKKPANEE